jgi:TP901 family phage tail tape measure protein
MSTQIALLVARVVADTSQFDKKMLTTNRIMGGVGKAGLVMAGGVAAGVVLAVKQAGDFQEQMNVLKSVTGASKDEMKLFGDEAIRLGADLKLPNTSAQDAAQTLTELSKGGLSVRDSLKAARGTIQLATAAQIDNADAAKIQARALKAFGLDGTHAAHVADLLANGANASTAEISDLALGFQQASAVFHSSGHTADELTTSITEMADAGITGSDAGTSLRTMMNRLNPQTKKAAEEFKKLGINVFDAHGNYKSMRDIVGEFSKGLDGLNPKQKQHALYTIFGSDAIRAANIVLDGGTKKYDAYHKKVEVTGTAQRVAAAHTKGFNGAVQGFISSLQTAAIQIGTLFLPMFTTLFKHMSDFMTMLGRHKTTVKTLAIVIFTLGTAMVALTGFYKAYMIVTRLATFYQELFAKSTIFTRIQLAALWVWEKAVTVATKVYTAAQWLLNAAMDANPITLVVIALIAIGIAIYEAYKHIKVFHDAVDAVWDKLKQFASWVGDVFTKLIPRAFNYVISWFKAHWVDVVVFLVAGPFGLLAKKAIDAFGLVGKLKSAFNTVKNNISNWASSIWNFFSNMAGKFASWGSKMGGKLKDAIVNGVKGIAGSLASIIRGAVNGVINIFNGLRIPGFSYSIHKGPLDFSIGIPAINLPDIPHVAQGGITTGPTLAVIGDNPSGREAIIPLPDRGGVGDGGGITINLTVNGSVLTERDLEEKLLDVLTTYGRRNGRVRLATASSI